MDWGKFVDSVCNNIGPAFVGGLSKFKGNLEKDTKEFLEKSKDDIENWTTALAHGELSKNEYETLMQGKIDVAKLIYLKNKGIGKIEIEKFTSVVIKTVVNSAFGLLP
jgi:ADP-dependent phosphofructokinase/glucokinase